MLLALDTSTDFASIALHDGEMTVGEFTWYAHRRHTVDLASQIDSLFTLADCKPGDLTAIAVAIGPGSYTGTRVALSLAKGIVIALGVPLVGIPTLDVTAFPHLNVDRRVCALVAAGRGRYGWAVYGSQAGMPQRLGEWGLHKLPELLTQMEPPMHFAGELIAADAAEIEALSPAYSVASPAQSARRASILAELAWPRLKAGDIDDPALLSPIYLS
ncbi:MAG: tRNA (adenosine(37)-N6)-threonylcarbamoyltransferase complex dimerization subunit type 1 TsaB [Caldilineales bacterium]|nr:tRNA (adenosine(37)-N6)-threonylcarbamoyltransferase complex dimerization subunit type 1 TsaB [Caldilineales bacterium]